MRAGFVARIRVNPKDCLSLLDIVQGSGLNVEGMSFSAITSLAMTCMIEAFRKAKTIPDNDGFDYARRMAPYVGGKSSYDKRVLTETLYVGAAAGLPVPEMPKPNGTARLPNPELWKEYQNLDEIFINHTPEQRIRYKELERVFTATT